MKLYVLFAQRKESYEGPQEPEALECINDTWNEIYPSLLVKKMETVRSISLYIDAKIFEIELPKGSGDFIRNQLMGKMPPIKAVNVTVMEE